MTRLFFVSVIALLSLAAFAETIENEPKDDCAELISFYMKVSPDMLSAYVAAYEEHAKWFSKKGELLNADSLRTSSRFIRIYKRSDGNFTVEFSPPELLVFGGSVQYLVDGKSFKVLEQNFPR